MRERPPVSRALALSAALLFLPLVGAAQAVLTHTDVAAMRTGDEAPFEARVLTLFDPPALLGPYSRHVWNHPGPLVFWLFGPPYLAFGRAPFVIQLAALALSALVLASIVRSVFVLAHGVAARATALVLVAALVAKTSATLDPSGLAVSWGPACTLLPFAALVLLSAELGTGVWRVAPFVVLLHAFVVQTHVLYFVPATLAAGMGAALAMRASPRAPDRKRSLRRAGIALGVLWAPVVLDELLGSGNLERIARFFVEERVGTPPDALGALTLFVWRATEPFRDLVGLGPDVATADPLDRVGTLAFVLAALALLPTLALLLWAALRRGEPAAQGGRVLAGTALAVLVLSGPTLLRVDLPQWPYLTWWIGALVVVGLVGAGAALLPREIDAHGERIASAACALAVTVIGLHTLGQISREATLGAERTRDDGEGIAEIFPIVEHLYACRPETQLDVAIEPLWGVLGTTIDHLGRAGTRAHVAPGWEFMFGPGYHGGDADARVTIMGEGDHGCRAIARGRWLRVGDCRGELGRPAAQGTTSTLPLTPWLTPDAGGALTFGLPPARLSHIAVTSTEPRRMRVEGSRDGRTWEDVAVLEPEARDGTFVHAADLPGGLVLRALRISPSDGALPLDPDAAHLEVDGELESVRVVDGSLPLATLAPLTDGVVPSGDVSLDDASLVRFDADDAAITVELPSFPVDALALTADAHAFRVEASVDGEHFEEIGRIPAPHAPGLSTRRFYFDQDVLASHVRLVAVPDARATYVAEVAPVRAPGAALDVGLRDARPGMREGFSAHEGDDAWAWIVGHHAEAAIPWSSASAGEDGADVLVSVVPFVGLTTLGTLTVRVGSASTSLPLSRGPQTLHAHVPREALEEATASGVVTIALDPSDAISPAARGLGDDARELSVAVHRIELRPAYAFCAELTPPAR